MTQKLKEALRELTYSQMMDLAVRIDKASPSNPMEVAEVLLDYAGKPGAEPALAVDAGPVPIYRGVTNRDILRYRNGETALARVLAFSNTQQGYDYWRQYKYLSYSELPLEPKAIIDAWCAELEKVDA